MRPQIRRAVPEDEERLSAIARAAKALQCDQLFGEHVGTWQFILDDPFARD
jgi:hypothetical protein